MSTPAHAVLPKATTNPITTESATNRKATEMTTTQTTTKSAVISARILARMQSGETIQQAMDKVLGKGAYGQLVFDMWQTVRITRGNS